MKSSTESVQNYFHKMHQIYRHVLKCENKKEPITITDLKIFIKSCTSPNGGKKGCAVEAVPVMLKNGILQRTNRKFYAVKTKELDQAINEAAAQIVAKYENRKKSDRNKQDVVQPTLFTESVMRERDQPIVTASDQLNHRINALESKLNTIITFFKTL
jgi:hypothetical protein